MAPWQIGEYVDDRGERRSLCRQHARTFEEPISFVGPTEAPCACCEGYIGWVEATASTPPRDGAYKAAH